MFHNIVNQESLVPESNVFVYEDGGIKKKYEIVVLLHGELKVAHLNKEAKEIVYSSPDEFREGKSIRLIPYGRALEPIARALSSGKKKLAEKCRSPEEVQVAALELSEQNSNNFELQPERLLSVCSSFSRNIRRKLEQMPALSAFFDRGQEDASLMNVVDDSKKRVRRWSHKIDPSSLRPGDHIYVYRMFGFYQHHGIYIGTNTTSVHIVIHFSAPEKSKLNAQIKRSTLDKFLEGYSLRLVSYNDTRLSKKGTTQSGHSRAPAEVIKTAIHYADHPDEWEKYNLVTNNCEMFAIFCKTGNRVNRLKDRVLEDQTQSIFIYYWTSVYWYMHPL